jgi:hypothetical protein
MDAPETLRKLGGDGWDGLTCTPESSDLPFAARRDGEASKSRDGKLGRADTVRTVGSSSGSQPRWVPPVLEFDGRVSTSRVPRL